MISKTNILSSIMDIPAKPEASFQVSHLERDANERFDQVFQQQRVDSRRDSATAQPTRTFEARERLAAEQPEHFEPAVREKQTTSTHAERPHPDSRPVNADGEQPAPVQNEDGQTQESKSKKLVNPFALPFERIGQLLNASDQIPGLAEVSKALAADAKTQGLGDAAAKAEGSPSVDTLKQLLAGLNIDSAIIDQLTSALQNGNATEVQGILNALRGLLQASQHAGQTPGADILADLTANRLPPPVQKALDLLVRAGLTPENAQQVIQQIQTGAQSAPDSTSPLAKAVLEALAGRLNADTSGGSGNLQNSSGDASGSARHGTEGARQATGLTADRLDTLASLIAPDKTGNAQTNPMIAKADGAPLLNLNASGQPATGALAEGSQAPAAVADAAAKGVDFAKPAITETYNGRASMDKPITAQIIEKFTLRGFGNQREVHIKLDPPSLGTVRMSVSTHGDSMRATIVAENHVVKAVIENNLTQLKDSITHQGIKIDSFNVLVGGNASHSAEGHKAALDYLGQLGREGSAGQDPAEEIVTLHRPVFMDENQSFSIFA